MDLEIQGNDRHKIQNIVFPGEREASREGTVAHCIGNILLLKLGKGYTGV